MFLKHKREGNNKGKKVAEGKKSVLTLPRKMPVLQLLAHNMLFSQALLMLKKIVTFQSLTPQTRSLRRVPKRKIIWQ